MARWREPGSINYERRNGVDPVLEAADVRRLPGGREFIIVCGMGRNTVCIRWYGNTVDEARETFRGWLSQPWQTLTTDFSGYGVVNGFDFKPSRIDWFNIAD